MHIRCLRCGTGSADKAARYLVGERDAMGREREGVEVLRGDPDMVAAVADSLAFEQKYRSIVIAWAPEDRPIDAQIEAVLDEFEKTAWARLRPDRYSWTAVLHREHGGGVHVHVLTARCDLETGKSLNIAPSGWQKTFDPLRDVLNHEHSWSRRDDPARARTQQPGPAPTSRQRACGPAWCTRPTRDEPAAKAGWRGGAASHAALWPGSTLCHRPGRRSVNLPAGTRRPCGRPKPVRLDRLTSVLLARPSSI